jgi:tryptophan synthase alpha chain
MPIDLRRQPEVKPKLVIYLTVGDPDMASTRAVALAALDAGAEVLELGVPFSDPVADGPVIQRASERSVAAGTRLEDVLALASELRQMRPSAGLVVFSYLNPILRFGLDKFCARAAESGVDGVLVTDLTVEEAGEYLDCMARYELQPIFLVAPTSSDARLKLISGVCKGFIYAVSRTGITGVQKDLASDARQLVERLRRISDLPIAVGFGVSRPEHVTDLGDFADAAVIGSAIISIIERAGPAAAPHEVARFLQDLRPAPTLAAG